MDEPRGYNVIRHGNTKTNNIISLTCGILKKKEQTKQYRNRLTDTENKLVAARGGGDGGVK